MQQIPALQQVDLSTVVVDNLTDQQIKDLFTKAGQYGITQDDLYTELQARGMKPDEIAKLKIRVSRLQSQIPQPVTQPQVTPTPQNLNSLFSLKDTSN